MESSLLLFFLFMASSLFIHSLAAIGDDNNTGVTITDSNEVEAFNAIYGAWKIGDWKKYYDEGRVDPCNNGPNGALPHLNCTPCLKVTNGSNSCHIISLTLSDQNIHAEIPLELFNLTMLKHLDLSKNLLFGSISSQISSLSSLEYLDLSINLLNGSVPRELSDLQNLTYLRFGSNNFSGNLPSLTNLLLEQLYFDSSGVSGQLSAIGSLSGLKVLWAFDNPISGKLDSIENLKNLTDLRIYGTSIQEPIPLNFKELRSLEKLMIGDLQPDSTKSQFPPDRSSVMSDSNFSFLINMKNLKILSLRNCTLTGNKFHDIQPLPDLTYLDLSFNNLNGTISSSFIAMFPALRQLYLGGGNKFSGDVSDLIRPNTKIIDLDVSFNPISGSLTKPPNLHVNYLGTSINVESLYNKDSKVPEILNSIKNNSSGNIIRKFTSSDYIAIKCGGDVHYPESLSYYNNDSNSLGAADLSFDPNNLWVVSNAASFPTNETVYDYTVTANDQIISENDPILIPLYQTARRSQGSLSYYIVGLPNANDYTVELHFAEIVIGDRNTTWEGLGKRFFNIKVQDNETKDFNIMDKAPGSNRALIRPYHNVSVINGRLEIHFLWTGRGTCCIPVEGTYGPLVSAIRIYQGDMPPPIPSHSPKGKKSVNAGVVVGILSLGIASILITSSVVFLWWEWIKIGQEMKY